jgi:hypothetical protein
MQKNLTEILTRWALDPVLFVEEGLGATPEPWQAEALRAINTEDRVAIRSGHGVGKSALLAWIMLWWMLTRYPQKTACTAPSAHQLSDVLWGEVSFWLKKLPTALQDWIEIKMESIELKSAPRESFCVARTARADRPEAFQGFHSENMLFIVDEASGVEDIIFEVGEGAMSTPGAKTILTGNPTRSNGYFFEAFHKSRERWHRIKVACSDSARVSPDYVTDMAEKYGEESNVYRVRVLGEFPRFDDDVLMPLDLVEAAVTREVEPIDRYMPVWGLDVARFGNCRTALAKRRANLLMEPVKAWFQRDLMEVAGLVLNEYEETPTNELPAEILVDAIGIGAGVVDRLRELGLPVRGINVAESPSARGQHNRLRDELWWRAREWFEARECKIPDDDKLVSELTSVTYKFSSSGKIQVERKDEMLARGMQSPDEADAFVLTFAGLDRRGVGDRYLINSARHKRPRSWMVR